MKFLLKMPLQNIDNRFNRIMRTRSQKNIQTALMLLALGVFSNILFSQTANESVDMSDITTITSPSPKFKHIYLQSHKGLPRFGAQNMYHKLNERGGVIGIDRVKNDLLKQSYQNYFNLLFMKFLSTEYDDIDREYLTEVTHENRDNKKDINSKVVQANLHALALGLGSKSQVTQYFCDQEDGNCRFKRNWSGTRDDFEIQEKYAAYVKENLDDLRAWSKTLFKDNSLNAYWVHKYEFNPYGNPVLQYDFEKNGYWVDVYPSGRNHHQKGFQYHGDEAFFFEFLPETAYGNNHLNIMNDGNNFWPKMLLKLSPSDAEALVDRKTRSLYATFHVNIIFKEVNNSHAGLPQLTYTFHLTDPIITFYEDVELTQKLAEISLEQPIYKEN